MPLQTEVAMASKLSGDAVRQLVEGDKLRLADILLVHSRYSLTGWLVRLGSRSYWNHAAMLFVVRNPDQGYDSTFIIESGAGGVNVCNIVKYLGDPRNYDVAIRRLDKSWFRTESQFGGLRYQRRIRGFAIEEIGDHYDYQTILQLTTLTLRHLVLGLVFPFLRFRPPRERRMILPRVLRGLKVNAYICSGFIQWAYYNAVNRILQEDKATDPKKLEEVVFLPKVSASVKEEDLLSTTPADLATTDKLAWKYVMKRGVVWEVGSTQEVEHILLKEGAPAS